LFPDTELLSAETGQPQQHNQPLSRPTRHCPLIYVTTASRQPWDGCEPLVIEHSVHAYRIAHYISTNTAQLIPTAYNVYYKLQIHHSL